MGQLWGLESILHSCFIRVTDMWSYSMTSRVQPDYVGLKFLFSSMLLYSKLVSSRVSTLNLVSTQLKVDRNKNE